MPSKIDTVARLFEYSIALERAAETLYRQLEKMFAVDPELALFWKRYADEEAGHALYLEHVRADVDASRLAQPADVDMMRKVRHCLKVASPDALRKIKTLEDAYELATELENSETNAIFEFVILSFSTEELAKAHSFLRTQLSAHIARLENDFPKAYRTRTAREQALAVPYA